MTKRKKGKKHVRVTYTSDFSKRNSNGETGKPPATGSSFTFPIRQTEKGDHRLTTTTDRETLRRYMRGNVRPRPNEFLQGAEVLAMVGNTNSNDNKIITYRAKELYPH